jgi:hypothetical protein
VPGIKRFKSALVAVSDPFNDLQIGKPFRHLFLPMI